VYVTWRILLDYGSVYRPFNCLHPFVLSILKLFGPLFDFYNEWNDDVMFNALNGDNEDEDLDDYEDYDWNDFDDTSARDCISWEEDMIKNGEYF
jgi:hypothetical protein